jgi:hypothetical protein
MHYRFQAHHRQGCEVCSVCNCWGTVVPVPEREALAWPVGTTRACTVCIYERREQVKEFDERAAGGGCRRSLSSEHVEGGRDD